MYIYKKFTPTNIIKTLFPINRKKMLNDAALCKWWDVTTTLGASSEGNYGKRAEWKKEGDTET
jgi:hypothetical protein